MPTPKKLFGNRRAKLLLALGILLIFGLAVIAYEYYFNHSAASWSVASDSNYFSYEYPTANNCASFLTATDVTSQNYALGERVNAAGVNCTVGPGAAVTPFLLSAAASGSPEDRGDSYGEKQMAGNSFYQLVSKTPVSKSGLNGTRWEYKPQDSSAASIIYYYFKGKSLSFAITINDNGAKASNFDVTATGEQMYSTLSFTNTD